MRNPYKRAIAMSALIRACMKKRPRGIFTYTGFRYDDGRVDLRKTLQEQFLDAVTAMDDAVFDNGKANRSRFGDAMTYRGGKPDLVYIDPPYYSPLPDNEYVRRYHFVEGLARDWSGVEIQKHTQTKKFKSYPTPFSTRKGTADAFNALFRKFRDSILIVSYSSNSIPTMDEMLAILSQHKSHVEVVPVDYRYSFGNQGAKVNDNKNEAQEYLFVGY
jgi:DNA adenine methylase